MKDVDILLRTVAGPLTINVVIKNSYPGIGEKRLYGVLDVAIGTYFDMASPIPETINSPAEDTRAKLFVSIPYFITDFSVICLSSINI